jgi:hypothetical protein
VEVDDVVAVLVLVVLLVLDDVELDVVTDVDVLVLELLLLDDEEVDVLELVEVVDARLVDVDVVLDVDDVVSPRHWFTESQKLVVVVVVAWATAASRRTPRPHQRVRMRGF